MLDSLFLYLHHPDILVGMLSVVALKCICHVSKMDTLASAAAKSRLKWA